MDELNVLNTAKVNVIRDGIEQTIDIEDLVIDDIVILADWTSNSSRCRGRGRETAKLISALLTGEADEITKEIGDPLMSGSFIVSGKAYARLDKVGADSYISRRAVKATTMGEGDTVGRCICFS